MSISYFDDDTVVLHADCTPNAVVLARVRGGTIGFAARRFDCAYVGVDVAPCHFCGFPFGKSRRAA